MHFMLVNDDGYLAEGFRALARAALRMGHRVTVCAPDRERSCASHSFTAHTPLTAKPLEEGDLPGWKIDGLPADCARLGLYLLRGDRPDMVLSGINNGNNLGGATVYSGTVGAAVEAAMCGVPAVASSMASFDPRYGYDAAAELTVRLALWAAEHPLPRGACYNLNVPDVERIRGVRMATLSPNYLTEPCFREYTTPWGRTVYWTFEDEDGEYDPSSDWRLCCHEGFATVTPVGWNCALPFEAGEIEL